MTRQVLLGALAAAAILLAYHVGLVTGQARAAEDCAVEVEQAHAYVARAHAAVDLAHDAVRSVARTLEAVTPEPRSMAVDWCLDSRGAVVSCREVQPW